MTNLSTDMDHLKNHIDYPATTEQVLGACNNMSDLSKDDSSWITKELPGKSTYKSADEVISAMLKNV